MGSISSTAQMLSPAWKDADSKRTSPSSYFW
nr:MAG TPA: hypothetical protein [Caudoviricetes sp.]